MNTLKETLGERLAQDQDHNQDIMQAALSLQEERDRLLDEKLSLFTDNEELKNHCQMLQNENSTLKQELETKVQNSVITSQQSVQAAQIENVKLKQEVECLQRSFAKIELTNEKAMTSLKTENKELKDSVQNYEAKLVASLAKLSPAFKDCTRLEDIVKVLDSKKAGVVIGGRENGERDAHALAFLQQELNRISGENQALRDQVTQVNSRLHQNHHDSTDTQVSSLQQQLAQLQWKFSVSVDLPYITKKKYRNRRVC